MCRIYYRFEYIFCSDFDVNKHLLWRIYWWIEWILAMGKIYRPINWTNLWCDQPLGLVVVFFYIKISFQILVVRFFFLLVYHFLIGKLLLSKHYISHRKKSCVLWIWNTCSLLATSIKRLHKGIVSLNIPFFFLLNNSIIVSEITPHSMFSLCKISVEWNRKKNGSRIRQEKEQSLS